jgi:ribose-phosphate pyrophosphokinase
MTLVGEVAGKTAILVDDMADTCGTLVKAASVLIDQGGAKDAIAIVTHGILSGNAIESLNGSRLKKIVVTNTVPHEEKKEICDRIETIDISPTVSELVTIDRICRLTIAQLAEACRRTHNGESVSFLFKHAPVD